MLLRFLLLSLPVEMQDAASASTPPASLLSATESSSWKERRDAVAALVEAVKAETDPGMGLALQVGYALPRLLEDTNVLVVEKALELAGEVVTRLSSFPCIDALLFSLLGCIGVARLSSASRAVEIVTLIGTHDTGSLTSLVKCLENSLSTKAPKTLLRLLDASCCIVEDVFRSFGKDTQQQQQQQQGTNKKQVAFTPALFQTLVSSISSHFSNKTSQVRAAAVDLAALLSGYSANYAEQCEDPSAALDAASQIDSSFRAVLPKGLEGDYDEASISLQCSHQNTFLTHAL